MHFSTLSHVQSSNHETQLEYTFYEICGQAAILTAYCPWIIHLIKYGIEIGFQIIHEESTSDCKKIGLKIGQKLDRVSYRKMAPKYEKKEYLEHF